MTSFDGKKFVSVEDLQNQLYVLIEDDMKIEFSNHSVIVRSKSYDSGASLEFDVYGNVKLLYSSSKMTELITFLKEKGKIVTWFAHENAGYYCPRQVDEAKINMLEHELHKLVGKNIRKDEDPQNLDEVNEKLAELAEKIDDFENKCDSLESDLSDLSGRVDDFESNSEKFSDLESDVSDLKSSVSDLEYYDISEMCDTIKELERNAENAEELSEELENHKTEFSEYKTEMEKKYDELVERMTQFESGLFKGLTSDK